MPEAHIDGVSFYYETHGDGLPLVLSHEFAGDYRSWEPQVRFFSRRYRVITYNARGYPPSDVPVSLDAYSQERAVEDLRGLLDHLGIETAHIGGLSMGGNVALNFGLAYPEKAISLVVAGMGTGSDEPESFRRRANEFADRLDAGGMEAMSDYTRGPARVQLLRKDPKGWREFAGQFAEHSATGSALTLRGVQGGRPPIYDLEPRLRALRVPTLIIFGDEDDPCIQPGIFVKGCIPRSGLAILPQSGHAINLEEPDLFNRTVLDFLTAVECGKWAERDPGAESGSLV